MSEYHGTFESLLTFRIIFWGFTNNQSLYKVYVLQKRALSLFVGLIAVDFETENVLTVPILVIFTLFQLIFFKTNDTRYQSLLTSRHIFNFEICRNELIAHRVLSNLLNKINVKAK